MVQLSHLYMTTGKTIALTICTFVGKRMSLLFNTLSGSVIAFLPRSNHLLISWLQSPSTVILEPEKIKSVTVSIFSPYISHKVDAMVLVFWMLSFKPAFSLSSFTLVKKLFDSSSFSALEWYHHCFSLLFFPRLLLSESLLRQPLCLLAFFFLWDGFGHCLLSNVMNFHL